MEELDRTNRYGSNQLPGFSVMDLLQKFIRVGVADYDFGFRIPFKRFSQYLGNEAEVTRSDGSMGCLRGSDTGFSRTDTVEEITIMIS